MSSIFAIIAGACFGAWPLIMRLSGFNPALAAATIAVITLATCLPFLNRNNANLAEFWKIGALAALVAGIINGLGQMLLQKAIGAKDVDVTRTLTLVVLTQIVMQAIGGRFLYGEPITFKKGAGILLALVVAKLLTEK